MQNYLRDPEKITAQTFDRIRELTNLDRFSSDEKQVVLQMIRTCGDPSLAEKIRFSPNAIEAGKKAIKKYACMLYDSESVKCGFDEKLLYQEPMCFINKATVISQAKANKQTRAMTAVDQWKNYSKDAIVIIGYSGTALTRLLELLKEGKLEQQLHGVRTTLLALEISFCHASKTATGAAEAGLFAALGGCGHPAILCGLKRGDLGARREGSGEHL